MTIYADIFTGTSGGGGTGILTVTGNTGGAVSADGANNINIIGGQDATVSVSNNAAGITVAGNAGTNTETIILTNRLQGTVITTDATPTTLLTFPLGAVPGTYVFNITISAFNSTNTLGAGYVTSQVIRTTGVAGVAIGITDAFLAEEGGMTACVVQYTIVGNNMVLQVTGLGPAVRTIDWIAVGTFIFVS